MKTLSIALIVLVLSSAAAVFVVSEKEEDAAPSMRAFMMSSMNSDALEQARNDHSETSVGEIIAENNMYIVSYWRGIISRMGAEAAYAEFGESVAKFNPTAQHHQAHLFGTALYSVAGRDALSICGASYSYGCTHAVLTAAIQEEGSSAIVEFADACRRAKWPPMCLHGIGHGLVQALGYQEADISKVIDLCVEEVEDPSTPGCVGGAIMEYNGQTMMGADTEARRLSVENKYSPCNTSQDAAKSACYLWLVSWWYEELAQENNEPEKILKQIGEYCKKVPDSEYTAQCLAGAGEIIASVAMYDGAESKRLCEAMSEENSARLLCKAFAANIILEDPTGETHLKTICGSVEEDEKDRCIYMARMGVSIFD